VSTEAPRAPTSKSGLLALLKAFVEGHLDKPSIIIDSAEASRFQDDDAWNEAAQEQLISLYDETLDSLRQGHISGRADEELGNGQRPNGSDTAEPGC